MIRRMVEKLSEIEFFWRGPACLASQGEWANLPIGRGGPQGHAVSLDGPTVGPSCWSKQLVHSTGDGLAGTNNIACRGVSASDPGILLAPGFCLDRPLVLAHFAGKTVGYLFDVRPLCGTQAFFSRFDGA
jgi:hypothetical protein